MKCNQQNNESTFYSTKKTCFMWLLSWLYCTNSHKKSCHIKRDILWPWQCICGVVYSHRVTLHLLAKTQQCPIERSQRVFSHYQQQNTKFSKFFLIMETTVTQEWWWFPTVIHCFKSICSAVNLKVQVNCLMMSYQCPMKSQLCPKQQVCRSELFVLAFECSELYNLTWITLLSAINSECQCQCCLCKGWSTLLH